MVNLKYDKLHQNGFTIVESITALLLFSVMLMLYLPAFMTEMHRQQALSHQTANYRIFYELAAMYYAQPISHIETGVEYHNFSMHSRSIATFRASKEGCQIEFMDGEYIDVSQQ